MIGQVLGERYELKEIIGDGGMSTVYKGHCQVLDRVVAVKILKPEFSRDAVFVERFKTEALAVARISHPNIVNIFDVGQEGDVYYIVMECVEGKSLKELIQEKGTIPVETALDVMVMVLDGLHHAHEKGIIHRDIKPQNILITSIGMVKVADFGIARAVGSGTINAADDQKVMGTVQYMAPEQARGEPATRAVDIYSAGCMLYEMLTGQIPFNADHAMTIAMKHLHDELPAPSELNPDISPGLEGIIFKAMEKLPQNRFASAEEMRNALIALRSKLLGGGAEAEAYLNDYSGYRPGQGEPLTARLAKRAFLVLAIVALMGLGASVLYVISGSWSLFGSEVEVPDLTGLTVEEATARLEEMDLKISVLAEKYDEEIPAGEIITQDTSAGLKVKEGRTINVTVSKGTKDVEVVNVVGHKKLDAIDRLEKLGLEVATVEEVYSSEYEAGLIVSQNPGPGKKVKAGSSITLQVSKGKEGKNKVKVPGLVGLTLSEASQALTSGKLALGIVDYQASNEHYVDEIIEQSVPEGAEAEEGTSVDLLVSSGPGPVQKNRIVELELPADKDMYNVVIIVHDDKGDRTAYDETHNGNDTVYAGIDYYGKGSAEVYLDGKKYQNITL